jgi:hypothetical protein
MTVRRFVYLCGLMLFPLHFLLCQQAPANPQSSPPRNSSSSTLVVGFGPTSSNAEGLAAANKLLQALGGAAKVNAVKTLRQTVVGSRQGRRLEIEQTIAYPDKQAQKVMTPQGKVLLVVTPKDAFTVIEGEAQDLPQDQRSSLNTTLKHDFINVLQHINDPNYIFVANGNQNLDGLEATTVDVEAAGVPTRWWIGPDGKLLRERYYAEGGKLETMTYAAWKNFDGLQYPTKYEMFKEAGQPELSMTLTGMVVNPVVSPRLFQRPAN